MIEIDLRLEIEGLPEALCCIINWARHFTLSIVQPRKLKNCWQGLKASCMDPDASNCDTFFFKLTRGEKIQIPLKAGHYRPSKMTFLWRADDGPTLNAGLVTFWFFRGSWPVLLKNPIFLWFFRGVWTPCPPPPPPPLWIRPWASTQTVPELLCWIQ